ncbi:hypothetical protein LXL04_015748 [Taraxacum kok-saghyz]
MVSDSFRNNPFHSFLRLIISNTNKGTPTAQSFITENNKIVMGKEGGALIYEDGEGTTWSQLRRGRHRVVHQKLETELISSNSISDGVNGEGLDIHRCRLRGWRWQMQQLISHNRFQGQRRSRCGVTGGVMTERNRIIYNAKINAKYDFMIFILERI